MRILITGITGFVGVHLARHLLVTKAGEVFGLARDRGWTGAADDVALRLSVEAVNLLDTHAVCAVLNDAQPQQIYHLAGYADAGGSFADPHGAWEGNLAATQSLYEAILDWGGKPRVLFVSSGAIYGEPERANEIIVEATELRPSSPYAASKAAADLLSYQFGRTHGLDIIRVRPFNHIGPGQSARYAVANFARQIVAIEQGTQPAVLRVGNLEPCRDLTDVRDVVRGYGLLMGKGKPGEAYNLASGTTRPMRVYLDLLLRHSNTKVAVEADPTLLRSADPTIPLIDVSKLKAATGWRPEIPLEQTLRDVLEDWRQQRS
jgi:GDP-4-dehydro-6-deoxy-D-mannose reductase